MGKHRYNRTTSLTLVVTLLLCLAVRADATDRDGMSRRHESRAGSPDEFATTMAPPQVNAVLTTPALGGGGLVSDALSASGLEVVTNSPAVVIDRDGDATVMAITVQPEFAAGPYALALLVQSPEGTTPLLLDISANGVRLQLIGTDEAIRVVSSGPDTATIEASPPFAPNTTGYPGRLKIGTNGVTDTLTCLAKELGLSSDVLCALIDYAECVAISQPSPGAFVGCAKVVLKGLAVQAKKEKFCSAIVGLASAMIKCVGGAKSNAAPEVKITSVSLKGFKATISTTVTDKDSTIVGFAVYTGSRPPISGLAGISSGECAPSTDWKKLNCTTVRDFTNDAKTKKSVDIIAEAIDFFGKSGTAKYTLQLKK